MGLRVMTPKQEAFARAYVETGNASEAYRKAGYSQAQSADAIHQNACKLLTKVMPRVEQLQQKVIERHDVTIDTIAGMLKEDRELARSSKQSGPAVTATMGLAKLYGLITDKRELTVKTGAEDLDDSELADLARAGRRGTSASAGGSTQPN